MHPSKVSSQTLMFHNCLNVRCRCMFFVFVRLLFMVTLIASSDVHGTKLTEHYSVNRNTPTSSKGSTSSPHFIKPNLSSPTSVAIVLTNDSSLSCTNVRYAYAAKGFDDLKIPHEAISGNNLRICRQNRTCCTKEMETTLSVHSQAEFESIIRETLGSLHSIFETRAAKYDGLVRELIRSSRKDFHNMFLLTYGLLYEKNSAIFTDLFQELEQYYLFGGIDLSSCLNRFFTKLYIRMFVVLNGQYNFEEKYLSCVASQMVNLKPFGDVPHKLIIEVQRSFVASRIFGQALNRATELIKQMMEIIPSMDCWTEFMKMRYCPHCMGILNVRPCFKYCTEVVNSCLVKQTELNREWNRFVIALEMVTKRLQTSFNIESAIHPLDIKISEAIMNFQETSDKVSTRIFDLCGRPRIGKRETRRRENHRLKFDSNSLNLETSNGEAQETQMDRLLIDVKRRIRRTKDFWLNFPNTTCSLPHVSGSETNKGTHKCLQGPNDHSFLYSSNQQPNKINVHRNLVSRSRQSSKKHIALNSLVNQRIHTLRVSATKLHYAYNGLEVDEVDSTFDGSGNGSPDESNTVPPSDSNTSGSDIFFHTEASSTTDTLSNSIPTYSLFPPNPQRAIDQSSSIGPKKYSINQSDRITFSINFILGSLIIGKIVFTNFE